MSNVKSNSKKGSLKSNSKKGSLNVNQLLKMTNEQLAEANLDNLNLDSLIKNRLDSRKKSETSKIDLYKGLKNKLYNDMNKKEKNSFRKNTRKMRNAFLDKFLRLKDANNNVGIKKEFKAFKTFYIERYYLNDYSINSICRANSDKETIIDINIVFSIFKSLKLK